MSTPRRPFPELLGGLQQGKLSLTDVINDLNQRGPVQSPLHKAELAMLDEALAKGRIDDKLHRLLTAKLKDLQNARPGVAPARPPLSGDQTVVGGGDDRTAMNPGSSTTVINPASPDRTVMNPGADKTALNPAGDKTALNPAGDKTTVNPSGGDGGFDLLMSAEDEKTEMGGGAETTGFKPSEPTTRSATGTGTGGKSGPSTSSWQRVATQGGPEREVHAGDVLKDRFFLEKEVGRGGMGIVFKARDERKVEAQDKNPWVAVKILNPEFRKHPQALVALQRESRKAQQLTHDNILRVYDFDKDQTVIYMTMEYVDGGSLKDVIKKNATGMPFDKGWPIIEGLARGLGRAHRDNIVHSDFKPGNVMMTSDLVPKLFDLGIARAAKSGGEAKGETTVFDAGELGALTPAYASLEMIEGQPPELIDDIYALGITAYEILTGKHPFNKKNAQQAMKEGLKPPAVPGLTRRQNRTLQASIAFKRADRVKTCEAFIEGMRPLALKDYALPAAGGGLGLAALLFVVFGLILPYLKGHRIDGMIQQFATAAFGEDTNAAVAALNTLSPDERETALNKGSQPIQDYFFKVANDKWDLTAKPPKYHFPEAMAVLTAAKDLFPDSARVAKEMSDKQEQKDKTLVALREDYDKRLADRKIYEDTPGNVVETLAIIAQIDPQYDLFKSQTLPLEYQKDVQHALDTRDFETATKQVATAVKVFPQNDMLKKLAADVKNGREQEIARAKERELREKMTAEQAKQELVKLAANPEFSADWQLNVRVALSKLSGDTSAEMQDTKAKLADVYAQHIGQMTSDKELGAAQLAADDGMKLFPGAANLMKEVARLTEARKAYEAEQAKAAALARVDDLKSTLLAQAKANETQKAVKALSDLKVALAPTDPFLVNDAPKAIGDAYLRLADKQAAQNRFGEARRFVAEGLKVAPNSDALKSADRKYLVDGSAYALQAGASDPASARGDDLKAALATLKAQDPQRADKLAGELQGSVLDKLRAMAKSDPAGMARGKAEWLKVFPQDTQLASLVIPAMTAAAPASVTPSLPQEARKARPHGVETCLTSFSTFGRSGRATCQDDVGGAPGPKLVVIPGPAGGYLAMTKYEITAGQFDAFCNATKKCRPQGGNDQLPRTNVSLALAKAYAAWLSEQTGFNYRLPTDAEWTAAANAGGQGAGEDLNCVLMQGSSQIKGGIAVPVNSGRPNAWGLVNIVGNAAEWVDDGSARGGNFNVPMSQCTADWKQSGSESDTTGLRLVREVTG